MRSLFLLLLIINACYLVWGVAFSEKTENTPLSDQSLNVQSLTLLSETQKVVVINVKPQEKSSKKSEQVIEKPQLPSRSCYSLGPVLDEENVIKLEQKLQQNGISAKRKSITDKEPKSYWVYFPPEKSFADAKAVVNQLKIAEVKDYFIVRKGEYVHAISLGLYNGYRRAKIRQGKLKKLGFNAKVQTRYHDVTRHWLDFQENSDNPLEGSVWDKLDEDNPLQKIARPCVDPLPNTS